MDKAYVDTVRLLLEVAPYVYRAAPFVLKGGTALNLFVRNMPRLSVDINVVYSNWRQTREEALKQIAAELAALRQRLASIGIEAEFARIKAGDEVKLLVRRSKSLVKVEVNFVFRGTLLPVAKRDLVKAARDLFTTDLSLPVLSILNCMAVNSWLPWIASTRGISLMSTACIRTRDSPRGK